VKTARGKVVGAPMVHVAGYSVAVREHDGAFWLTAENIADVLGYADACSVTAIYRRHADELRQHRREARVVAGNGSSRVALFAPVALPIFASLAKTTKAAEFRAAVAAHVMRASSARSGCTSAAELFANAVRALEAERDAIPLKKAKHDHETPEQTKREALDDVAALGSEGLRILELVDEDINETAKRFRIPLRREDA
jgi:prophage antirepressor-like protein